MVDLNKDIERLLQNSAQLRGEIFQLQLNYIEEERVDSKRFKEVLKQLGVELDQKDLEWISWGVLEASLELSKDFFNWEKEDIFQTGQFVFKYSKIKRSFLDSFNSPQEFAEVIDDFWTSVSDQGDMQVKSVSNEQIELDLEDFNLRPSTCQFIKGMLEAAFNLTTQLDVEVSKKCDKNLFKVNLQ